MSQHLIEFNDFSFKYHAQEAASLKHLSLSIDKGEKLLITGASGSGKSTFAQVLNGIIPHVHKGSHTGTLHIASFNFGRSISKLSTKVSTILQDTDSQFIGLTVAEDLAFVLENDALSTQRMHKKVKQWAEWLSLETLLDASPQTLSGGQKQRVALAGVLIDEADILLFDEPLANLDPKTCQETVELIKGIQELTKKTIIIIEHRLEEMLAFEPDRILLFDDGRLISDNTPHTTLKSGILSQYGLREPLYLSALDYAGVDRRLLSRLDDMDQLLYPDVRNKLLDWLPADQQTDANTPSRPVLSVSELSVNYGDKIALEDISFSLFPGEKVAIVGPNGAGKSTLASALCGFVEAKGDVAYYYESLKHQSIAERAQKIGYVLQNPNHMLSQTLVKDEVALGLKFRGLDDASITHKVDTILKICGLFAYRNWPISALSYGQKKRVTVASVLVLDPPILILDEPTAGQDLAHYQQFMGFLDQLSQQGITILIITHDMHLMLEYTDRVLVIESGKLIADSDPSAVLSDPELLERGHLARTSLHLLADKLGLDQADRLIQQFMADSLNLRSINNLSDTTQVQNPEKEGQPSE